MRFYYPSLRYLSIGGRSLRNLPTLLSALLNLRFLSTDIWGIADMLNESIYYPSTLSHLHIKFKQQTIILEEIHCLLSYVPYLEILIIEGA